MPLAVNGAYARSSTADVLAARLRDEIADGTLVPGQALRQEELAARLGVSRSPLREALRQLQAQGLIVYEPNRGAVVSALTPDDIRQIYEIRRLLEPAVLRLAIPKLTPEHIARARATLLALPAIKDRAERFRQHWIFHKGLYDAANRPRLVTLIEDHYVRMNRLPRREGKTFKRLAQQNLRDDRILLQACARRDVRAAERAMLAHLDHTQSALMELV